jgi:flagellar basal-body rod modification protein FlgD
MGAAAGLFSQSLTAGRSLSPFDSTTGASASSGASSSSSSSSSSSDGNSAIISANDFLELLVTEMQNQDPTDATDPNEYINQLVNVNSLEQLIDINQTLSGAFAPSTTGDAASAQASPAAGSSSSAPTPGQSPLIARPAASIQGSGQGSDTAAQEPGAPAQIPGLPVNPTGSPLAGASQAVRRAPGNLSVPAANPAAQRVAHSLDGHGHPRAKPLGGKLSRFEQTALNNRP